MPVLLQSILRYGLLLAALAPLAYYVLSALAAWRFFRRECARTLPDFTSPVSLLKPVRGVDFASYENFSSFCRQDYPDYELLFVVNEMTDPAVPLIERLQAEFPQRSIRIFSGAAPLGANRKISNLCRIVPEARHEILVLSDGDVRVGPRYLREVVAPFADPRTGLVTCFYRGIAQGNLFAELEAVGAASDFFAGVLMAGLLEGLTFALGATMVTTKSWIVRIGGLETIADLHSDDYELGHRIFLQGGRIVLSREPVWTMYPAQSFRGYVDHQVRWARTVRLCRPLSYAGLLFTHGLPWAVAAALVAPTRAVAAGYLGAYLLLRLTQAWVVGVWVVGDEVLRRRLWLVPLRDAGNFFIWLWSFASNRIVWGETEFEIRKDRMAPIREPAGATPPSRKSE
ncbi:MAG: bacteriohopanetetrol glucosamine biosynthesis glycosyltransferase HpnI [Acidobacteriia bacterium]|nr:bacteriohopanetetrol glucosamine biosynthesis glycosyltransferase HpnI [Terriglobia bacterium]